MHAARVHAALQLRHQGGKSYALLSLQQRQSHHLLWPEGHQQVLLGRLLTRPLRGSLMAVKEPLKGSLSAF